MAGYGALVLGWILFALRYSEVEMIGVDSTIHVYPTTFEGMRIDVHNTVVGLKTSRVIQEILFFFFFLSQLILYTASYVIHVAVDV